MAQTTDSTAFPMREPCRFCGSTVGRIDPRSNQDCVYCLCGRWQYNAPRIETGRKVRSVSTVHEAIRPSVRVLVLQRARGACELCHAADKPLHVAHLLGVRDGLAEGLTEATLNSARNMAALCDECNLGQGAAPMDPLVYLALLRKWLRG